MRWGVRMAVLIALAGSGSNGWSQSSPNLRSIIVLTGSCERLVTPDRDMSGDCRNSLFNMNYRSGRFSFAFTDGQSTMISFSGLETRVVGDHSVLTIDHVSIATHPGPTFDGREATGSCEYTDPYAGRAYVRCSGRTAGGTFTGSFMSDGEQPTIQQNWSGVR